jgi:hypothetical protein
MSYRPPNLIDVTHVLVRAHHGGAADAALQIRATGAVASFW